MSNRKEILRKNSEISDCPWSSDDDVNSPRGLIGQRSNGPEIHTDIIYPETRLSTLGLNRGPTPQERHEFWSMLNNTSNRILPSTIHNPREMRQSNGPPLSFMTDLPTEDVRERRSRYSLANKQNRIHFKSFSKLPHGLNCFLNDNIQKFSPGESFKRLKLDKMTRTMRPIFQGIRMPERGFPEAPQPSTSRGGDSSPPHLPSNALLTINLDQSDTDIEQQPQTGMSATPAVDVRDGRTDDVATNALADPVLTEEKVLEQEVMPAVDAVADQANASGDTKLVACDVGVPSVSITKPCTVKRKHDELDANNERFTVKEFNQSLLRLFECPVCLECMEPPMSQCRRGHLVCARCRTRLSACPVCRTAFSSVRNRAMEGVADMLHYPCRYGCGREVRLRRRGIHEASCSARRYRCPAPPCVDRPALPLEELHAHLQREHPALVKTGKKHKFSMNMNCEQHYTWLVLAARELFHLRIDINMRTWGVVVYVAYVGPKCNASNYTYEVTVIGQHNERKVIYSRVTHSDLENSSLNVSRQDCFHLTLDQTLNFLRQKNKQSDPEKFLDFYIEISKRDTGEVTKEASDI